MHRLLQFLVVCLISVGCMSVAKAPVFYNSQAKNEYESSVRIVAECEEGQVVGTGFIIDNKHIITAEHMSICDSPLYTVYVRKGNKFEEYSAIEDKKSKSVDAMRLATLENMNTTAFVNVRVNTPLAGEQLCSIGGGSLTLAWAKKCGYVSYADEYRVIASIYVIPGNSGSPVYDAHGRVVGIISAGTFDPFNEKLAVIVPTSTWLDLLEY